MIKSEIKSVLEKEMAGFRADINAVRTELQSYQTLVATELAMLKSTSGEMERSLSSCTDDIVTLQHEVAQLKAQSESLQSKCEDLKLRSRKNDIRIVGEPESYVSATPEGVQPNGGASTGQIPPRAIVAHMHYFQDCANLLRLAREKQQIKADQLG